MIQGYTQFLIFYYKVFFIKILQLLKQSNSARLQLTAVKISLSNLFLIDDNHPHILNLHHAVIHTLHSYPQRSKC